MIENIKELYKQLENRIEFISEVAPVVKKSVHTIQNHWFAGFWKVPIEHQEVIVTMLQNKIKLQNERKEVVGEN